MGKIKGCSNVKCIANKKQRTFKETDDYCSKCGNTLYYICKECRKELPDGSDKYCKRCSGERQDKKENALKVALGVTMTAVVGVATTGKKVIKVISKFKG